jgi:acetyl esterase/lipase
MLRAVLALAPVLFLISPASAQRANTPSLPEGTKSEKNVEYGPHERNKLDIYVPKSDKPLPLVIWVHGGGWTGGSKEGGPALKLLDKGYAVAAINYRFSQHAVFPAQIEDCQSAVRFLRANAKQYNLNPDAFGAWGASAGGHLVALMGTAGDEKSFEKIGKVKEGSAKVQAVCDWFGPIDFVVMSEKASSDALKDPGKNPLAKLIGGPVLENKEKALRASPLKYLSKDSAPFLIMHGDKDPLVPVGQSELFHEALKKAGVESTLLVAKGAGHDGRVAEGENGKKIVEFFDKHLKK